MVLCPGTRNNIIAFNTADGTGGGCWDSGNLYNSTIYGNQATSGGGCYQSSGEILGCIFWNNSAKEFPQLQNVENASYCCIQETSGGSNNIQDNPGFEDETRLDFHLRDGSPCIDAGPPEPEENDACRPPGSGEERNDMGVYGGPENCRFLGITYRDIIDHILGKIALTGTRREEADQNRDGRIDVSDAIRLIRNNP